MSSSIQHDSLRMTNLVQDYHPLVRRRAITSIRTSFPTFFSSDIQPSNILSMNQSQKLIFEHYNKIHTIIDLVDQHIRRRIECYQHEVINVVQSQIQQMREETAKVVESFNLMIEEKNKENQIWSLNNQLDYFKSQAKKLFQQNKTLRKENLQFKKQIQQFKWELQNREVIMQKLLYKYQKEKYHKQKIKEKMSQRVQMIKQETYCKQNNKQPFGVNNVSKSQQYQGQDQNYDYSGIQLVSKKKSNPRDQKQSSISFQNSSILKIQFSQEDLGTNSKVSINAESVSLTQNNKNVNDQGSQANIYISQYSYKDLFISKKKGLRKNEQMNQLKVKDIGVQTQKKQQSKLLSIGKTQNQTNYSSLLNKKVIDLTKNGFYIKDVNSHYRSTSNYLNGKYGQTHSDFKIQRLVTEPNFNSKAKFGQRQNFDSSIDLRKKQKIKGKNKCFSKMATRFQKSKVTNKAYPSLSRVNTIQK